VYPEPQEPKPGSQRQSDVSIQIQLIGGFRLSSGGRACELSSAGQRIVAMLAVFERPLSRSLVAGSIWPEANEARASGALRSTLWRLRSAAGDLVLAGETMLWFRGTVEVDLHNARRSAGDLLTGRAADEGGLSLLEQGDLVPEWCDEWVSIEQTRYRQLRLHALEVLSERLVEVGAYGKAVIVGLTAVDADPLRESAHRVLINAHLAEGNVCEARRQYARYAALLWKDMSLRPSQSLAELVFGAEGAPVAPLTPAAF
jgi:DNA-binding SARP family transcriptional activator